MSEYPMPDSFSPDCPLVTAVMPSPRFGERRGPGGPDAIVLHYTGLPSLTEALACLAGPEGTVSCHYVVEESGRVLQLVPEHSRAWHAGESIWAGDTDVNSRSIGIEIANPGHDFGCPDFPQAQIDAVIALCRDIIARRAIRPDRVLGHSDVAPVRKRDPGEKFPWAALAAAGVGLWVPPAPPADGRFIVRGERGLPVEALQALLALYGYGLDITGLFDETTEAVVAAFQRHFRPARVDGVADVSTVTTLRDLIAARDASLNASRASPRV
ncbi:N-acetylmuramoyl-L-alanine amidase [Blastochloris sulfoviridis]|uniref:N-acetylmuramoyl-L-alanine amidase n=2 Tax=Blastochloris sulfoviridis TaxID=50712 RepID=A0A5M6HQF8_9HYPH|nr:N-acetylmuramoyl-L-alanine amidase [Blastochloris sulfoviridis]